jgi:hypothetical protein
MNQVEAQKHIQDLMETFKIAFPMAFTASLDDRSEIIDGIAFMLRDAIKEDNTTAAAMTAIWFASRAPKATLLAFLAFLEEGTETEVSPDEEWPAEIAG